MSSDDMPLVSSQNGLNSQLLYREDPLRFSSQRRLGDPGPKTRELAGFIDDKLFSSSSSPAATNRYFSSSSPATHHHQGPPAFARNVSAAARSPSGDRHWSVQGNRASGDDDSGEEEEDDYDDEEDDEMEDDEEVGGRDGDHHGSTGAGGIVGGIDISSGRVGNNKHSGTDDGKTIEGDNIHSGGNDLRSKMGNGNGKAKDFSICGSSEAVVVNKDGGGSRGLGQNANAGVTVADRDGEMYYSQYLPTADGSGGGGKDIGVDNSFGGFNGRKDGSSLSNGSGDSLRAILSDPVTGALMEDAVILPCGHSFGTGGVQHIMRMKSCYSCSRPVSEESVSPNLALRAAVQAYQREEDLQSYRSPKRRRERFEQPSMQERGSYDDPNTMDPLRGRGVQFPFAVTDRVIIKGNKRTPERFVGREAVVTTQCLNGWYVVKTLDNAESVKLQYRSLAKVSDDASSSRISSKMTPNWI
ncbi:unnamed protein product [Linum tenue]|uniref:U-box domain-containing protein n=1 Tax=Linum tenue TaxID=586396 RepID=A0AAV0R558_9ROSI|nr:unnamed protein product [Linum tenue]